jgi:hypothetical protein
MSEIARGGDWLYYTTIFDVAPKKKKKLRRWKSD